MAKQIGQITRKYRERNHMSLRALARKSGVGRSYLSILEKGETPEGKKPAPSAETIRALADAMEMDRVELFQKLGMEVEVAQAPTTKVEALPLKPFDYIPLTKANVQAAWPEGRIIVLPFRPPQLNDLVYIPLYEMDGMVVAHTVNKVGGGVYRAYSELNGDVEFNIFDINQTVFVDRKAAYNKISEWRDKQPQKNRYSGIQP